MAGSKWKGFTPTEHRASGRSATPPGKVEVACGTPAAVAATDSDLWNLPRPRDGVFWGGLGTTVHMAHYANASLISLKSFSALPAVPSGRSATTVRSSNRFSISANESLLSFRNRFKFNTILTSIRYTRFKEKNVTFTFLLRL